MRVCVCVCVCFLLFVFFWGSSSVLDYIETNKIKIMKDNVIENCIVLLNNVLFKSLFLLFCVFVVFCFRV